MAVTQQEIENRLWDAADELRVAMPEAQYSSVVFPLMFWKYLSDTWEHQHEEFLADNEGLADLSAEEAHEIEYRDYQSFEIPFIHPGTVKQRRVLDVHPRHHHPARPRPARPRLPAGHRDGQP
jgi:type I restriction enzyme M protein